jgi:predicted PurR-regulated permease PerM
MLHSRQGSSRAVAPTTETVNSATNTAQEARHPALSVVALGVVVAMLYFGRVLFITAVVAVILAFILEPFVALLMRLRLPRALASLMVCLFALLFLYVIGLGAYAQLSGLSADLPNYGQRIGDIVDGVRQKIQGVEESAYSVVSRRRQGETLAQQAAAKKKGRKGEAVAPAAPPAAPAQPQGTPIGDYIYARLGSFYEILLMASFVPFLVYFMLSWQEHLNRSFLQFFHGEDRQIAARSLEGIARIVRAFVVGNFLLGLLLATISSMAFWLIHLPYPALVGPLSGFLSLLPYVGLPMALLPPVLAALTLNQASVYVLAVGITALLHLFALNLLYPKIVGSRVHLNPLVVTFSLMLWGFLWGASGLLLAIPLTAGVKAVCDNVKDLRPYGKFLGD